MEDTHKRKSENLRSNQSKFEFDKPQIRKNIIHNFSSWQKYGLPFSLNDNIPGEVTSKIKAVFECFYYYILENMSVGEHVKTTLN